MKRRLFSAALTLLIFLIARPAAAAIEAYLIRDIDKNFYQYNFSSLLNSYNENGSLWHDFEQRMKRAGVHAVYDQKSLLYVDFVALLDAYNKGSEIIAYTESKDAKEAAVQELIKEVTVKEGKLVYTNIFKSGDIVRAINNVTSANEVLDLLVFGAEKLGVALNDFNALNSYGRIQVAQAVLQNRPAQGYDNTAAIKNIYTAAVADNLTAQQAALAAVNQATTPEAMRAAVTEHATRLELDISRFDRLKPESQQELLAIMVEKLPYDTADQVKTAYITALQAVSSTTIITYVDYEHSLTYAVDKQMNKSPQTDLYGGGWKTADRNLVEWFINANNFVEEMLPALKVKKDVYLNMRHEPTTEKNNVILTLSPGAGPYFIISEAQDSKGDKWYRILTNTRVGWVHSGYVELTEKKGEGIFQFLLLSGTTHIDPVEVNEKILKNKGILSGQAEAFIEGAQKYNINEIFLISLALHETGNGTSKLAKGVEYKGKTVYNMYGIGAVDSDPINKGAEYAYNHGWFTPEAAIIGGAKFAGENYIHHATYKQDTLYKMRWNPASPGQHQYATDIGWASKQVTNIKNLYDQLTSYVLHFEIPRYK